jgi:hypothetical protein
MKIRHLATAALISMAATTPAAAQNAVTLYGGYRGGGSFEQSTSPTTSVDLQSSAAFSASLDWGLDAARQVQVFASYQSTDIPAYGSAAPAVPLTVSYLHLGGRNFFEGTVGRGAYLVGGLGVTRLSPGLQGLSDEYRPSMNLGLGYQLPLAPSIALRFELRGYLTLVNSNTNLFCSGGCVITLRGDAFTQAEAMVGLSFGF